MFDAGISPKMMPTTSVASSSSFNISDESDEELSEFMKEWRMPEPVNGIDYTTTNTNILTESTKDDDDDKNGGTTLTTDNIPIPKSPNPCRGVGSMTSCVRPSNDGSAIEDLDLFHSLLEDLFLSSLPGENEDPPATIQDRHVDQLRLSNGDDCDDGRPGTGHLIGGRKLLSRVADRADDATDTSMVTYTFCNINNDNDNDTNIIMNVGVDHPSMDDIFIDELRQMGHSLHVPSSVDGHDPPSEESVSRMDHGLLQIPSSVDGHGPPSEEGSVSHIMDHSQMDHNLSQVPSSVDGHGPPSEEESVSHIMDHSQIDHGLIQVPSLVDRHGPPSEEESVSHIMDRRQIDHNLLQAPSSVDGHGPQPHTINRLPPAGRCNVPLRRGPPLPRRHRRHHLHRSIGGAGSRGGRHHADDYNRRRRTVGAVGVVPQQQRQQGHRRRPTSINEENNNNKRIRRFEPTTKTPVLLQDNDVVCERGALNNTHPGTRLYRQHVRNVITDIVAGRTYKGINNYSHLPTNVKTDLSNQIVDWVHTNQGGRFLARDSVRDDNGKVVSYGPWYVILEDTARQKASQFLRDVNSRLVNNNNGLFNNNNNNNNNGPRHLQVAHEDNVIVVDHDDDDDDNYEL